MVRARAGRLCCRQYTPVLSAGFRRVLAVSDFVNVTALYEVKTKTRPVPVKRPFHNVGGVWTDMFNFVM